VTLKLPQLQPTWCMEVVFRLKSAAGRPIGRVIHNSIFSVDE